MSVKPKFTKDCVERGILVDLFRWKVGPYDPKNFDGKICYNDPNHKHIWKNWSERSFKSNLKNVVKDITNFEKHGTGKSVGGTIT